ncbi:MAG: hypothetical protein JW940_31380 [Polyangiaceae bacterium]|nr:hypothetical protein [Polyangiaceae bacterium]
MRNPVRICFWCTSFQADNQALACYLAELSDFEVMVATDRPEAYLREPVNGLMPYRGHLVNRSERTIRGSLERFAPHVVVIDNHLPRFRVAPLWLALWHGFGWRVDDLSGWRDRLGALIGDVGRPSSAFRWLAFGDWDREYRIAHSQLAPENVVSVGSPYSDLLLPSSPLRADFRPSRVQSHYSIDVVATRTVTLGLTWHHGGAFSHWGDDAELLSRFAEHVGNRGANLLVRVHDRHRYEPDELARFEGLASRFPHVQLKFKSDYPDSCVDLLVTDVLVSNYSSFLNAFYHTRRPSVHIDPVDIQSHTYVQRILAKGTLLSCHVSDPAAQWKLAPDQIGGLRARSFAELCASVDRALDEPDCCREASAAFCARYIKNADGQTRARIADLIRQWTGDSQ